MNNELYRATEHHVAIVEPAATDSSNDNAAAATNGEANHDTDASDNEKEKQVFY